VEVSTGQAKAVERRHIETERLVLRPLKLDDFEVWRGGWLNRKPSTYAHDDGPAPEAAVTLERFADLIRREEVSAETDQCYVYGIFERGAGDNVGAVELSTLARDGRDWANLGFWLHNTAYGKGYATEAVSGLLREGISRLGYHRIEAAVRPDNAPAVRVCEKGGLEFEVLRRGFWKDADSWADHKVYVALSAD